MESRAVGAWCADTSFWRLGQVWVSSAPRQDGCMYQTSAFTAPLRSQRVTINEGTYFSSTCPRDRLLLLETVVINLSCTLCTSKRYTVGETAPGCGNVKSASIEKTCYLLYSTGARSQTEALRLPARFGRLDDSGRWLPVRTWECQPNHRILLQTRHTTDGR